MKLRWIVACLLVIALVGVYLYETEAFENKTHNSSVYVAIRVEGKPNSVYVVGGWGDIWVDGHYDKEASATMSGIWLLEAGINHTFHVRIYAPDGMKVWDWQASVYIPLASIGHSSYQEPVEINVDWTTQAVHVTYDPSFVAGG